MHLVQSMAYVNETPWHGLGQKLAPKQPIEVWARQAGMDWTIESADVRFVAGSGNLGSIHAFPEQRVLYRSDSKAPLSVVSSRYQVVQPKDILEFYRDLTEVGGFELETAGVLKDGKKLWALARTGQSVSLKGRDEVNGYLLLATACDGTLGCDLLHGEDVAVFIVERPHGSVEARLVIFLVHCAPLRCSTRLSTRGQPGFDLVLVKPDRPCGQLDLGREGRVLGPKHVQRRTGQAGTLNQLLHTQNAQRFVDLASGRTALDRKAARQGYQLMLGGLVDVRHDFSIAVGQTRLPDLDHLGPACAVGAMKNPPGVRTPGKGFSNPSSSPCPARTWNVRQGSDAESKRSPCRLRC
ncbi:phage/plasmid-like protein [Burkholderia pseudomallei]|nr:phage/plasmid-like TIGR03299 family protein [Burkholderia pseudomallei]CAJ4264472.1 phage/plasmid-like TIGR03299 family protein [Burkholderia pseudomallei]CAJ7897871.1 phage/plasmid-like TIGR03299 family protein [Burkholderia pseudomallei]CAJ8925576.1 phage/plasmid-like TIGR03299 family protein [Burkholderia pseudomallei]VBN61032.1 phage/plasmid-like protein [Burkholderia pseudomallei]